MPREIITIQVGQCGNQIAMKFWDLALREHLSRGILFDDSMSSFFKNEADNDFYNNTNNICESNNFNNIEYAKNPILKARSLIVDTEEGVINQLLKSDLGKLFDDMHFIKGVSGAGNNWAHGHYYYGPKYKDSILQKINKLLEECDSPQCFMFTQSLGGGTGSGLGTYILNVLNEYYTDIFKFNVTVFPSDDDDVITSPYNTILSLNELINNSDCVMPVDNESLIDICNKVEKETKNENKNNTINNSKIKNNNIIELPKLIGGKFVKNNNNTTKNDNSNLNNYTSEKVVLNNKEKPFDKMNSIVANLLCNFTCSMRFEGKLNVDINDITMNLVPFPRLHFIASSISPLYHVLDKKLEPRKSDQIFSDIFNKNYQLISMDNFNQGVYLASALIARGDLTISDINYNISKLKSLAGNNKIKMVHWNNEGFKIGLCDQPPVNMKYGLLCLANTTAISDCFTKITQRFKRLYKVKAHIHHFSEYMNVENFDISDNNLTSLTNEYINIGYHKSNNKNIKDTIKPYV